MGQLDPIAPGWAVWAARTLLCFLPDDVLVTVGPIAPHGAPAGEFCTISPVCGREGGTVPLQGPAVIISGMTSGIAPSIRSGAWRGQPVDDRIPSTRWI